MKNSKKGSALIRRLIPAIAAVFILLGSLYAQGQAPVTGTLKDKEGKPIAGATIAVKGKKINTISSADGAFSISAKSGDVLLISSVGYESYEAKVDATGNL